MTKIQVHPTIVRWSDQRLASWRGGTTRAIYAYPPEMLPDLAAAQLWIGTATIERDGPYSSFPNRTRIHLPLRGKGLQLHFQAPPETRTLTPFMQTTFAGDRPLTVTLLDDAVEALNLIFDPAVQANLNIHHLSEQQSTLTLSQEHTPLNDGLLAIQLIYVVNGECVVEQPDGRSHVLTGGDAYIRTVDEAIRLHYRDTDVTLLQACCWVPTISAV